MKKKVIILALCTGLLAGVTVHSQEIKIKENTKTVFCSDNISPETLGICFVVKKDGSIDDDNNVYVINNATSDKDGHIEFTLNMPEMKNLELSDGEYDLYIKEDGKAVKKTSMCYASLATRTGFFNSVKDISSSGELKTILENPNNMTVLKAIGCATDFYHEQTAQIMYESIKDFEALNQESFKEEYNIASLFGKEEDAEASEIDALLKVHNPEFEGEKYNNIKDEGLQNWLSSYFCTNKYSDEEYAVANILYKFNVSVADKLDDLFAQYDADMGIKSDSRYIAYNNLGSKAQINIKIAESLFNSPAKSVEDLLNTVKAAVNSGTGTGSGGSGGGNGISSSTKYPSMAGVPVNTQNGASGEAVFKDLSDAAWAKEAVLKLVEAKIVDGDENGNFRPNDYINREEYVKMLVLAANKYNKNAVCNFKDVPEGAWYYSYVASANEYGVTQGISDEEFGIGKALTRQDMAVLSLRAKGEVSKLRENITFADNDEIADYAKDAVSRLYMSRAVSGRENNMFVPLDRATRAECAQIIFNLFLK